jgi:hypothetical protein
MITATVSSTPFLVNWYVGTSHRSDIWQMPVAMQRLVYFISMVPHKRNNTRVVTTMEINFFLIPFYLQAVQIHSANGVKLLEA